jgi:hypothetical protein
LTLPGRSQHHAPLGPVVLLDDSTGPRTFFGETFDWNKMNLDALYSQLTLKPEAKLALVVLDGLGDLATGGPDSSTHSKRLSHRTSTHSRKTPPRAA